MVARVLIPCLALVIHGCGGQSWSVTKITVTYPGATTQLVEVQVAIPVEVALAGLPGGGDIVSISSRGKAEIYLFWNGRSSLAEVKNRLDFIAESLPRSASKPVIETVTETPAVKPETARAPMVRILPDNQALEMHKLNQEDIWAVAMSVFSDSDDANEQLKRLTQARITTDSADVPLTDVAALEVVDCPIRVVRRNGHRVE